MIIGLIIGLIAGVNLGIIILSLFVAEKKGK